MTPGVAVSGLVAVAIDVDDEAAALAPENAAFRGANDEVLAVGQEIRAANLDGFAAVSTNVVVSFAAAAGEDLDAAVVSAVAAWDSETENDVRPVNEPDHEDQKALELASHEHFDVVVKYASPAAVEHTIAA